MTRDEALALMHEYTASDALRKHMYAVEIAMRAGLESSGELGSAAHAGERVPAKGEEVGALPEERDVAAAGRLVRMDQRADAG